MVAAPWYGYRDDSLRRTPIFDRPHSAKPFFERRPASFYLGSGLPQVFTAPYRPHFANSVWPQTYVDIWGDWYGVFAWSRAAGSPSVAARAWLGVQNAVGILPTLLALVGWLALLVRSLRPVRRGAAARRRCCRSRASPDTSTSRSATRRPTAT